MHPGGSPMLIRSVLMDYLETCDALFSHVFLTNLGTF